MQNYSIMPLDIEHFDELCEDIKYQYDNNIASCVLLKMTLTPEGDPAIDKAKILCEKYDLFRDKLAEMGYECGILAQATIGHGYKLNEDFAFQKYTGLTNGAEKFTVCPYDKGFREYIYNSFKTLAAHKPKVIMVDDDFRLIERDGRGCACPLHLKRLSDIVGENITREELLRCTSGRDDRSIKIKNAFIETQKESLVETAKVMRAAIDSVNPAIPGVFCCCGHSAEFGADVATELAGKGNPVTVRINNAVYTAPGARIQGRVAYPAAVEKIHLGNRVDVILAETDTCPQNRYSMSARMLHAHFTMSLLEGAAGAKHWITRLRAYEPASGKKYRETLTKYSGFYEKITETVPKLSWKGCNMLLSGVVTYGYGNEFEKSACWATCVLERLGIPFFYSSEVKETVFIDCDDINNFSDEDLVKILSGKAVLSSRGAKVLIERGFGKYLGVSLKRWEGDNVSFEKYDRNGCKMSCQMGIMELIPENEDVITDSMCYHLYNEDEEVPLFPGCTIYKNELGGVITVFAGTPKAPFTFGEGFSFLNETRKAQLVNLLTENDSVPLYLEGDDEVYVKAGEMKDGALFVSVINTSFDALEEIKFYVNREIENVFYLNEKGEWTGCEFSKDGKFITVNRSAETLLPVMLKLS